MSHLTAIGKRATSENPDPSPQPNKLARTNAGEFHSTAPQPINGRSYTPLPSFQTTFNPLRAPAAPMTSSPGISQEEFYALKERFTQFESKSVSSNSESAVEFFSSRIPDRLRGNINTNMTPETIGDPGEKIIPNSAIQNLKTHSKVSLPETKSGRSSDSGPQSSPPPDQPVVPTPTDPSLLPRKKTDLEEGNEFFKQKEYKTAIEHYLKALEVDPKRSAIPFNIGHCYRIAKEFPKAIECYSKVPQSSKFYIDAQINIAKCYNDQEEYKQAVEILSKIQVPESDVNYSLFHTLFGKCHMELRDPSKAIEHYEKVSRNSPLFALAQLSLGSCYHAKNDPQTAIGFFEKAILLAESDEKVMGRAHYNLGAIYVEQKDDSKAIQHLKLVPEDHERFNRAQERLKRLSLN